MTDEQNSSENLLNTLKEKDVTNPNDAAVEAGPSELEVLKNRARILGISFSNNISVETLKSKIQAKMDGAEAVAAADVAPAVAVEEELKAPPREETKQEIRARLMKEQMKLVRLRITNLNPQKKDLNGEIITVGNKFIGTVSKFVPFGEQTENGYHVPFCIYTVMRDRTFVQIKTLKDARGREYVETKDVREFALEVLPQLTTEELSRLAIQQAAEAGMNQ